MKEFTCTLGDLESLQDNMTRGQENGKRFYQTPDGQKYPSVTTVTGLLTRDHIKLWRERVGEEVANKISSVAARRGTKMHSLFEQYLRAEEELVFENILDESMFKAVQPVCIIDFKTSAKYKEEYMADPWFHQMTAYAIMVEELTGEEIDSIVAVVAVDGGGVQVFEADPRDYVEKLYELRNRYGTLYGV